MTERSERTLARAVDFDVQVEDHGFVVLSGHFEYGEDGIVCQGLGYAINAEFLKRFMGVFDIEFLQDVNGKSCWATHVSNKILKLEPLRKKDGVTFDIEAGDWVKD